MAETVPLGDLVSITRGTTYKSARLGEPGPVLLGLASIARNGGFRGNSLKTYGGESPEKLLVHPGELYASLKDVTQSADLLGSVARVPLDGPVGRLTQDTVRLDIISNAVDPSYLYLSLLAPEYRAYCRSHSTGTTNLGLPREDFLSYQIRLPSLAEQRRIAGVLGALDDLIETNRHFAQQVRDLSSTLYAKFAAEALGTVPLGQVAAVSDRKVRPGTGSLRYIDIAALSDGYLEFPPSIDWADAPSRARIRVEDGSTLWSTVRPNRRAHALVVDAPSDLVASTGIAVLTPRGIGPAELFAACDRDEFVDQLVAMADGSAYPAVRPSAFHDIVIRHFSSSASAEFEQVMWPLWCDVHAAVEEISRLTRARDELLPLLMSGRVRVREVA